jgi:transglycosylase-like protein with SLT domain
MRFYVASAAIIVAAAIPFASSSGDNACASCATAVQLTTPAASGNDQGAPTEPASDNSANQSQPDVASEAAAHPDVCTTLVAAARDNELPPVFLARLIWQESGFDPQSVSHAGAVGIAQFMPRTAKEMGLNDPYDPAEALPASARLLSKLNREFGNLGLAAAAYNAGSGRIRDWLSNRQSLPRETQNYVRIITGNSAKDWTEEQSVLELATKLPRGTPCPNIDTADSGAAVPVKVALSSEITGLIRRAKEEMEAAAARAKRLASLAKLHRGRHGKETEIASRHGRKTLAAHTSKRTKLADA